MNIPDNISEGLETIFCGADPDPGCGFFFTLDPGFGVEKFGSGIQDKHSGFATLQVTVQNIGFVSEPRAHLILEPQFVCSLFRISSSFIKRWA
jgi:hypothetical protein